MTRRPRPSRKLWTLPLLLALPALCALPVPAAANETTWYGYYRLFSRNYTTLDNARSDSRLFAAKVGNRWGLLDQRGVLTVPPIHQWTDDGIDGVARFIRNGKTGYIDGIGNVRIEPIYDWLDRFADGVAIFKRGGRYGLIDQRGRVVLEPRYDDMLRFRENYAAVQINGRIGFINRRYRETITPQFAVARSFHQGLAAVRFLDERGNPAHWGYVNVRGDIKWQDRSGTITELRDFNDNLAAFRTTTPDGTAKWGYLDQRFAIAIPPRFDEAGDFTDHLASVADITAGGWGFINRAGDWELAPQFDWADDFDDRLAMIRYQGKFGFIDRTGRTGLYPQFAEAEPFEDGYAVVSDGTNMALVTTNAGVLFDPADITDAQERNQGGVLGRKGPSLLGQPILDRTSGTQARLMRYPRLSPVPYRLLHFEQPAAEFPVPYEPEYRYEERLPRDTPGGLLISDEPVKDGENDTDDPGTITIDPELKGVIPETTP